ESRFDHSLPKNSARTRSTFAWLKGQLAVLPVTAVCDRRKFLEVRAARKRQADASANESLLIRRYENVLARKLLEQRCWPAEIRCQNINRIASDPCGKINRLINSGVKTDQQSTLLAPNVFNRVPISLWNVTDIASV